MTAENLIKRARELVHERAHPSPLQMLTLLDTVSALADALEAALKELEQIRLAQPSSGPRPMTIEEIQLAEMLREQDDAEDHNAAAFVVRSEE